MHGKGLVVREETQRAHTYRAAISKDSTQSRILGDLVQKLFDGSAGALVMRALGAGKGLGRRQGARCPGTPGNSNVAERVGEAR